MSQVYLILSLPIFFTTTSCDAGLGGNPGVLVNDFLAMQQRQRRGWQSRRMAVTSSALLFSKRCGFVMLNEHEEEVSPRAEVCASAYVCLHLPNIMWVIGIFLTIGIAAIKHFLQLLQLQNSCHLAPILCRLRAPRLGSLQSHPKESVLEALEVELHNTHGPPI